MTPPHSPRISARAGIRPALHLNAHIAAAAWLILRLAAQTTGADTPFAMDLLTVCGVLTVYGLDRMGAASPEDAINHPARTAWLAHHRRTHRLTVALALAGLLAAWLFSPLRTRIGSLLYIPLAAAYAKPLPGLNRRLQDIRGLKIPLIVISWTLFPLLNPEISLSPQFLRWSLHLAAALTANVLWSEWHDAVGDRMFSGRSAKVPTDPAAVRRLAAATLLISALLQTVPRPSPHLLLPLFLLGAQELQARKNPKAFAAVADLYLLAGLALVSLIFTLIS